MRIGVDVGRGRVVVQGDSADLVRELAVYVQQNPDATIAQVTDWINGRGLAARVSMEPAQEERTSR